MKDLDAKNLRKETFEEAIAFLERRGNEEHFGTWWADELKEYVEKLLD